MLAVDEKLLRGVRIISVSTSTHVDMSRIGVSEFFFCSII